MKVKKLAKLQYNLWYYFILFTVIFVAFIWVVQILLFSGIYRQKKYNTLRDTGEKLSEALNTDEEITDATIGRWLNLAINANETGIITYIAYVADGKLNIETIYSGYVNKDSIPDSSADSSGGSSSDSSSDSPSYDFAKTEEELVNDLINKLNRSSASYLCDKIEPDSTGKNSYFVYITTVKNRNVDGYLVLKSSQGSLTETVSVMQLQLIIITGCVVVVSFFLSLYMSKKLARPIVEMSKTAKSWAEGNENVTFKGESYEEVAELADALNYAKEGIAKTGGLQRDLLANVSHDLKTPLTMIKAYAEMIRDLSGDIKEKRDAHTQVIIDETDRLTMLVNDILDLSKLQSNVNVPVLTKVNLSELCEKVLYRFHDFAENSGYTIISDIDKDLYSLIDEKKIEQVFYNLIGNSINYTGDDKTIKVTLKNEGDKILFQTIDSGKGISEDKIETVWNKYYRFSETHQRPVKGTGLGLSIVKTILLSHGLRFGVISEKGVGSNFFVEFKPIEGADKDE
ncbi:MAG TPA: hypothetical protein DDY77_01910 [Clostridiales bacterium]|nr:hypothetical protein [Clostridiales bacterium]